MYFTSWLFLLLDSDHFPKSIQYYGVRRKPSGRFICLIGTPVLSIFLNRLFITIFLRVKLKHIKY
ncbi:hypothetical protein CLV93_107127 [Prolixibacter denitrificans]|uniref:Uncharacterized protein n=1 Tax=Prolixibacter denitrificans TaxID=1541063 RepID=A0A2P8CAK5_9BACT|nr:hypothetical protein CLV93_107127 [Prolixibacter denitrificans]